MPVDLYFFEAVRFQMEPALSHIGRISPIFSYYKLVKDKMEQAFKNFEVVSTPETPKIYRYALNPQISGMV